MDLPVRVALGTMHRKEEAIAPPLAKLGVSLVVPANLDTDQFGTFSGETPRVGTMLDAARAKARLAAREAGLSVGLASEGAYGPHPSIPLLPLGREILLWRNEVTGHEIVEMMLDDTPCFDQTVVSAVSDAADFLDRVDLAQTAVVVAPKSPGAPPLVKGERDRKNVLEAVQQAMQASPEKLAVIQTDMRAHMNDRRMTLIAGLAERLAARLATPCPACGAPGFGIARSERGLACKDCGAETELVRALILACGACRFETEGPRPDGRLEAEPAECPECNP